MKTNKWFVAAVIAIVVLVGVYGGKMYLENRVIELVRGAVDKSDSAKIGAVRFSLSDRKLVLSDVDVVWYKGTPFAYPMKVASAEVVLPWGLLGSVLTANFEGEKLVAETLEAKGVQYAVRNPEPVTVSFDTLKSRGIRTNLALLQHIFSGTAPSFDQLVALSKSSSVEWSNMEGVVATVANKSVVKVGSVVIEKTHDLQIDAVRVADMSAFITLDAQATPEKVLEFGAFSLEKIDIPADALRVMFEMPTDKEPSPEQTKALLQALFNGKAPLIGGLEMQKLTLGEQLLPLSVRSWRFTWLSADPMHYTTKAEGIVIPASAVTEETGLELPNLKELELSLMTEVESDAAGNVKEQDTYSAKDLFDLNVRASVKLANPGPKGMPTTLWGTDTMLNAVISGVEVRLEDKGLMAYILLNVEGPDATGDGLLNMIPLRPGANRDAYTKMMDSIKAFVKQPGTLSVGYTPEKPVPFMQLLEVMGDPSAYLTVSSTPGTTSAQEQVKKIQAAK